MTGFGRSAREQAEFEKFHCSGTEVLRNKLDLREPAQLETAERYISGLRLREGLPDAARGLDAQGLQAIHRHLFQDVYEWAGDFRTYTTGRGPAPFATPENITPWLDQQFAGLRDEDFLSGLDADRFAARVAHYVNEINAAHPFIEGNGRVQRVWLRNLAEQAERPIRLSSEDREQWYEASIVGFENADPEPMADLIRGSIVGDRDYQRDDGETREFTREFHEHGRSR